MSRTGVLITAFGGPRSLEEVGPFIATMTGREPSPEMVERSQRKYASIGGGSPLPEIAGRIAGALAAELESRGRDVPVRLGMRYAEPRIAVAVDELRSAGAGELVSLSLSPFESEITTKAYREAVAEATDACDCRVHEGPAYHLHEGLVAAHADALGTALAALDAERPFVIMTAHSLPCEETIKDDTYVRQLGETADAVARAAGLAASGESPLSALEPSVGASGDVPWMVAYQSRGYRQCAWLEPELDQVLEAAAGDGYDAVVLSPIGFVTDHMETMYDLDIVARKAAEGFGLAFVRAAVPNDDARLIAAFADAVEHVLPE